MHQVLHKVRLSNLDQLTGSAVEFIPDTTTMENVQDIAAKVRPLRR